MKHALHILRSLVVVVVAASCASRGEWVVTNVSSPRSALVFQMENAEAVVDRADLVLWLSERPWKLPNLAPWPNAYEKANSLPDGRHDFDFENLGFPGSQWWNMGVGDLASQGKVRFFVDGAPIAGVWVREVTRENVYLKEVRSADGDLLLECCHVISF